MRFSRRAGLAVVVLLLSAASPSAGLETAAIAVGPLSFDARMAGPRDGELVLLLHGFPQGSRQYERLMLDLAAAGYRAVAFDQRGYSSGARPVAVADYAMRHLVGDVLGVADALGYDRFHVVGHDWGAAVAWVLTALHPDRVASLVALSTPHVSAFGAALADEDSEQARRSSYMADLAAPDAEARLLANGAAGLRAIFAGASGPAGSPFSSDAVEAYVAALGNEDALRGALNWYRASAPRPGPVTGAAPSLPPIRVPTLYAWSDADPAFAPEPAAATGRYVEAAYRFEVIAGAGHWLLEEAPDRVASLVLAHLAELRSRSGEPAARVVTLSLGGELPSRGRLGGVATGPDGSVYVSNFGASVWRVSPDGSLTRLPVSLQGSSGNAVLGDGSLLQASFVDDRVVRVDPAGGVTTFASGELLAGPVGIAVGESGEVFVCSCRGNAIVRIRDTGDPEVFVQDPLLDCPNGIALGPDGALYVVSLNSSELVRIDGQGSVSRHATLAGERNAHIAFAAGSFWVTRVADNRIDRVSADGRLVQPFAGTGERGQRDGPAREAELSTPNGIAAAPDGRSLYFNDLEGEWRGETETRIHLRRLQLGDPPPH